MSLKSPITYAEWYWKHNVDAQKEFSETVEDAMSPQFIDLLADIPEFSELPAGVQSFLKPLAKPHSAGLDTYLVSAGAEFAAEVLKDVFAPIMKLHRKAVNKLVQTEWFTLQQAITLAQRKWIEDEQLYFTGQTEGYADKVTDSIYESQMPYPTIPDIILWARYHSERGGDKALAETKFDISDRDFELWKWQTLQRLTTVQVQSLYKWNLLAESETDRELAKIGWNTEDIPHIKNLSYLIPNAMLQVQGNLMQGKDETAILKAISESDIHPKYNKVYYDAVLTKPPSQDIIAYQLRQDPTLTNLPTELKKIGIHPDYTDLYKELAYPIPPVADIITMAVREAFTPEVAARFGQYEDFPKDFEKYAGMRGLSSEWAERYWAAHWNLPSPTQGFEMLHRGVINRSELDMLLRAQDVMPFWRDKLVQIAYRPLTRVDVRRMYKLGVLDEGEVYEAYLDAGYEDENAKRMAEFTVKQTLATQMRFKSTDIVKAFVKRMISRSDATSLLAMIDISYENASRIIETAEYKREWAFTEQQIRGIRNLYKKKVYDVNSARGQLSKLNLPSDQIEILMQQWYYDVKDEVPMTWTTAQTLRFIKAGLITADRGKIELSRIGYDAEHINVYMESIK